VNFTDQSTNAPTSWAWAFGDSATATVQNPSYTFAAGTYTVALTATNADGSDTETKVEYITVTAAPFPPVADFVGSPTSGTAPLTVNFTDQSTNAPTSWAWAFGDSATATVQNPSYTFQNPSYTFAAGTYTVALTATNTDGSHTETKADYITVTVAPLPPVADFVCSSTFGTAPLTVNFTDQSTNAPTSWAWTFGDSATAAVQNPSYTYTAAGTYTVALTATNADGSHTETKADYITVTADAPPGDPPRESSSLALNQPTPFGPESRICFSIPHEAHVRLDLFKPDGRHAAVLIDGYRSSGRQEIAWEPAGWPTGVYFLRLACENQVQTSRMVLIQ
jgi:PKD repeat protein